MAFLLGVGRTILFTVVGHGLLLWLKSKGVHPEEWVARVIDVAATPGAIDAIWWIIAGFFGVLCTALWEMFGISRLLRSAVGGASAGNAPTAEAPRRITWRGRIMPFGDAARLAYEETRHTRAGRIAESMNKDDVLGYYRQALKDHEGARFFGMHPPSQKMEPIDPKAFASGTFSEDGSAFTPYYEKKPKYERINIRRGDVREYIKRMKAYKDDAPKIGGSANRVPLLELRNQAATLGWDFRQQSMDIVELCRAIKQAGSDGDIRLWGRLDRNIFAYLTKREALIQIPSEHWVDFEIDAPTFRQTSDNFNVRTFNLRADENGRKGYADLHIDRAEMRAWLKVITATKKGKA